MITTDSHTSQLLETQSIATETTIALVPWGDTWEDWFDSVGVSFETFCTELTGGWKNNYIDALSLVGVKVVMIYASARVTEPSRFIHQPTGATICLLPISKVYAAMRRRMIHPHPSLGYYESFEKLFGDVRGVNRRFLSLIKHIAPYVAMPIDLLLKELKHHECSAILCQDYEQSHFDICVLLGKFLRLPVYTTFQGGKCDYNQIGRWLRPFTMRACNGFLIGTQTEISRVQDRYRVKSERINQLFNPVNINRAQAIDRCEARTTFNIAETTKTVVWHGRVDFAQKGLDILLAAWEQLCSERPGQDLRLMLMGTGTDANRLQQLLACLTAKNIFWINEFINDRSYIQRFLSAGDVYAFPSRYEGFPVAPIEAMACGLPVVATNADGIPDIFCGGETSGGIVVPIDDTEAFSKALGQMIDNQSLRLKLGKNARQRVETAFSLDAVGQQLYEILLPSNGDGKGRKQEAQNA